MAVAARKTASRFFPTTYSRCIPFRRSASPLGVSDELCPDFYGCVVPGTGRYLMQFSG
ncbi:hypothetical protein GWI33_021540, partial [Rhynchophorus ferrugineus]